MLPGAGAVLAAAQTVGAKNTCGGTVSGLLASAAVRSGGEIQVGEDQPSEPGYYQAHCSILQMETCCLNG